MESKVALVSGGTDGVGFSIAKALVKENYSVHVLGSNSEKGKAVENKLGALGEAKFHQVDLSDLDAVVRFANAFSKKHKQLDRLVLSAGVLLPKRSESQQGFERTFAINYLSAYVLCHNLFPILKKSEAARVAFVTGGGAIVLRKLLNFDDLMLEESYSAPKAAARGVHAKTVLAQALAEQWKDTSIAVNAFHPGIVKGSLGRSLPFPLNLAFKSASVLMPKECATGIDLVLSSELEGVSGCFFEGEKQKTLSFEQSYCERLIKETESLVGDWLS